ncbi:MAG: DUF5654 family protein [Candidatus Aenigmarchaeota archaeon]|nr:DUF5654 family protein [Candidatus Aenigmarchaeota archaeon]
MEDFEKAVGELEIKDIVIGAIMTGLGFRVAVTWRDAIQVSINYFVPHGEGLAYSYLAAIIVTLFAFGFGYILIKVQKVNISRLAAAAIPNGHHKSKETKIIKRTVRIE